MLHVDHVATGLSGLIDDAFGDRADEFVNRVLHAGGVEGFSARREHIVAFFLVIAFAHFIADDQAHVRELGYGQVNGE